MNTKSLLLASTLLSSALLASVASGQKGTQPQVNLPNNAAMQKVTPMSPLQSLATWNGPNGAPLANPPRLIGAKSFNRSLDSSFVARIQGLDAIQAFTPDTASKVMGISPKGFFFTRKLGMYEGTRVDVLKNGIRFEACIDFLNPKTLVTIMQQNARSGAVAMGRGSEAQLHLPGTGGYAAIRFAVDGNSSWTIQMDGLAENTVNAKAATAGGIGLIEFSTELSKGGAAAYSTLRLRANADSQFYNAEVAIIAD